MHAHQTFLRPQLEVSASAIEGRRWEILVMDDIYSSRVKPRSTFYIQEISEHMGPKKITASLVAIRKPMAAKDGVKCWPIPPLAVRVRFRFGALCPERFREGQVAWPSAATPYTGSASHFLQPPPLTWYCYYIHVVLSITSTRIEPITNLHQSTPPPLLDQS